MVKLPVNEKKLLSDIFNSNQTPHIQKLTELIKARYKKDMESISPAEICNKINFHVFLMHGANDSLIPYTESMKLNKKLKKSSLFLSGLYEHRELSSGNSKIKKIIEFYKMSSFFTKFMEYNGN